MTKTMIFEARLGILTSKERHSNLSMFDTKRLRFFVSKYRYYFTFKQYVTILEFQNSGDPPKFKLLKIGRMSGQSDERWQK